MWAAQARGGKPVAPTPQCEFASLYRDHPIVADDAILLNLISQRSVSVVLEVLHSAFVCLCGFLASERTQIAPAAGLGILLARVKTVLTGF